MVEAIAQFFRDLYEKTGLNFNVFYDAYEFDRFVSGAVTSLQLMCFVIVISLILGLIGATLQRSKITAVRIGVEAYVQVFRNTPPMVQLLFFYFGLGSLTPQVDMGGYSQPLVSSFAWAVIALGAFGGAYNVEIFRAGIEAVPKATLEACESLSFSRWQINRHVLLPLALRTSFPSLVSNIISLAKTTSLAYVISVPEMTYVLNQVWSDNVNVPEMIVVLFVFYTAVIAIIAKLAARLERRLKVPGFGQ